MCTTLLILKCSYLCSDPLVVLSSPQRQRWRELPPRPAEPPSAEYTAADGYLKQPTVHEYKTHNARHQQQLRSSGAVWESRWPSWAPCPNETYGFCGRKATMNHAYALVTVCPQYVNPTSEDIKLYIIFITNSRSLQKTVDVLDSSRAEVLKCSPPPKLSVLSRMRILVWDTNKKTGGKLKRHTDNNSAKWVTERLNWATHWCGRWPQHRISQRTSWRQGSWGRWWGRARDAGHCCVKNGPSSPQWLHGRPGMHILWQCEDHRDRPQWSKPGEKSCMPLLFILIPVCGFLKTNFISCCHFIFLRAQSQSLPVVPATAKE